jgi:diguanylate cyclase (GGDEF)-like protein
MQGRGAVRTVTEDARWPRLAAGRYPNLAYAVFAAVLLVGSVSAALLATVPSDADVRRYAWAMAVTYLCCGVAVWFLAPRVPDGWGLDVAIVVAAGITVCSGLVTQQPETQVLLGSGMILLAVYAAYFRPPARFLAELGLMLGLYGFVVLWWEPLMHPAYWIVVVLVTAAVSVAVAVLVAQLREMAVTDSLTGALNRHGLRAMADYVRAEALREGSSLTVVLLDVDRFKTFNDRFGHLAGDQLLIDVAGTLRAGLRAVDVVARFGGDEFALLLRGVDVGTARALLDRIQPPGRDVSWSVGVAAWDPSVPLETALSAADDDLYRMKRH